jgi:DNA-binding response OmpR family regulator
MSKSIAVSASNANEPNATRRQHPLVLLVEDEPEVMHACQVRLQASGFDVDTALDGDQAIAKARSAMPDAIVLDVRMSKKDGLTALAELKSRPETRDIPVIMLSASLYAEAASLRRGARFFLRKPFRSQSLVAAIDAATHRPPAPRNPSRNQGGPTTTH